MVSQIRKERKKRELFRPVFTAQEFGESVPNNRPVTYLLRCVFQRDHLLGRTVTLASRLTNALDITADKFTVHKTGLVNELLLLLPSAPKMKFGDL